MLSPIFRMPGALSIVLLLAASVGCAHAGFGAGSLLSRARAALESGEIAEAYVLAKRVETEHPGSPESREAFPVAAQSFKHLYSQARYQDPTSAWITVEPDFMFRWLASYFDGSFPQQDVSFLFGGMSVDLFRQFEAYAKTDPRVSHWKLRAEDDNGFIHAVTALPIETDARQSRPRGLPRALAPNARPPSRRASRGRLPRGTSLWPSRRAA